MIPPEDQDFWTKIRDDMGPSYYILAVVLPFMTVLGAILLYGCKFWGWGRQ